MPIETLVYVEKDTKRYQIAAQCLLFLRWEGITREIAVFTDGGDLSLLTLYQDMLNANARGIRQEEQRRLQL